MLDNSVDYLLKGVTLGVDNLQLNGQTSFEVADLAVAAKLGFVGLTAGGVNSSSGVHLDATFTTGLDRDPNGNTPGDTRFSFNDLVLGNLFDSFYTRLDGEAYAKLKGLEVNGGFGNISIDPNLELGVYVPSLSAAASGLQTVYQPLSQEFNLDSAIATGQLTNKNQPLTANGTILVMPDLTQILSLKNLSFADVITGIQAGIDAIDQSLVDQPFYTTPLPVINRSLKESFAFLDNLAAKLQTANDQPALILQDVESVIESALGINDDNELPPTQQKFSLSLSPEFLDIHFNWQAIFSDKFDFNLDLETFKQLSGNAGAAALDAITALADLKGGAGIGLEAIALLNFDLGINLASLKNGEPEIVLRDYNPNTGKGTRAFVGTRLEGSNLDLGFKLGPMDVGVSEGTVILDGNGQVGKQNANDYAGLDVYLDQQAGNKTDDGLYYITEESIANNLKYNFKGDFDVNLPIRMGIGGLDFNLDPIRIETNPIYGDQGLKQLFNYLGNSSDAGANNPVTMSFPDIRGEFAALGGNFSLLSLLNDPGFILDGVDLAVGSLEDVLDSNLAQDVPLLGDKLATAASFLRDIRQGMLGELREKLSGNGKAIATLRETLYDVLGPDLLDLLSDRNSDGNVTIDDVLVGWYDVNGNLLQPWVAGGSLVPNADSIQFDVQLGGRLYGDGLNLPLDFNLPGFSLDVNGGFGLDLGWNFDFGFGLSVKDSFYLVADPTETELNLDIAAFLDGQPLNPDLNTPFNANGKLLFFDANLTDNNPNGKASGVYGQLGLDLIGDNRHRLTLNQLLAGRFDQIFDVDFDVQADLDLGMTLQLKDAEGLPKLAGDLELSWNWGLGQTATKPNIAFQDLRIDMGSLVNDYLKPISQTIADALEPVRPLIDVLNTKVSGLDRVIRDNTIKGLVNLILEIKGRPAINWAFVDEASRMLDLAQKINSELQTTGWLNLGSISGFGTGKLQPVAATSQSTPADFNQFLQQNTRQQPSMAGVKRNQKPRSGFKWDYVKDISNWTALLSGGDATLFTYELPILEFKADFDLLLASIGFLPKVAALNLYARGGFTASADLGFGYDTYGVRKALSTSNPLDAFDGFYLMDYNLQNQEKDEFSFQASIGLAAALGIAIVEAGLEGFINLDLGVDLQDIAKSILSKDSEGYVTGQNWQSDGKIRASEIATMWNYDNDGDGSADTFENLANVKGGVKFSAGAFVDLDLFFGKKRIFNQKIFEAELLDLSYKAPQVQPTLAKKEGSTLYLSSGSRAANRIYNVEDGGEKFIISGKQAGNIGIEYDGFYQTFSGITKIVADGGVGDDLFDASLLRNNVTVEFTGGVGDDTLIAGLAGGILDGGEGDDLLDATKAISFAKLIGAAGNDTLKGGTANDLLDAGVGNDVLNAGVGNDTLKGGTGVDRLSGEAGDDTYVFGSDFNVDRLGDNEGSNTFDFSEVAQQLNLSLNLRGVTVIEALSGSEIKGNSNVRRVILGTGNDLVNVTDFAKGTFNLEDAGGNDTYRVRLGRANSNTETGIINLNDRSGNFDEVIIEQTMKDAIALNQDQLLNGREVFNYNSGVDRLSIIGKAGQYDGNNIIDFGGEVTLTNSDNNGISRLGTTDLRVIAKKIDLQAQINADAIILETISNIDVDQVLNAINNGYLDLRTYGEGKNINLAANLKVSAGDSENAQGNGWIRLVAPDGSIINTNAAEILASGSHLMAKVKNTIATKNAPLKTQVAQLTAATALHGAGDIIIEEVDGLILTNQEKTASIFNTGLTIPNNSVIPTWVDKSQWINNLSDDWRGLISDGNDPYAVVASNGNIEITLFQPDALLNLTSGKLSNRLATGNITLTADDLDFRSGANMVEGTNNLTIQAQQLAQLYRLGTAAETFTGNDLIDAGINDTPAMELSNRDLAAIADGFANLTIGRLNSGNTMILGDIFQGEIIRNKLAGEPDYPRTIAAQQPEFRDTTILLSDRLEVRGDARATGENLTFKANTAQIYPLSNHEVTGSGVTAANLKLEISDRLDVQGWLRATNSIDLDADAVYTSIGSIIETTQPDSLISIDATDLIASAGLIEAKGSNSIVNLQAANQITIREGGTVAARDLAAEINLAAEEVITIASGGAVIAGARFEDQNGKPTAIKTGEGADARLVSGHELLVKGTVTTADEMVLSAGLPLNSYNDYFSELDENYLNRIEEDQFSILMTGTLTSLADNTTLDLTASDDIIIRGNINVLGDNSNLNIRSDGWVYQEGFIDVNNNIIIQGGYNSVNQVTGGASSQGSSVYVHTTSRINTRRSGSVIVIQGAQDVDIFGSVVAGGTINETGVTWAGNDSQLVVKAGEQIYLDTGLLASGAVRLEAGVARLDDQDLSILITTAGGITSGGYTSDNSGGLVDIQADGNLEMMGWLLAGGQLEQEFDQDGKLVSQAVNWSDNPGTITIAASGQAFIGGNTKNKQGEDIQTGGYLYASDRIEVIGGQHPSDTGVYVQGASELVTHNLNSSIWIDADGDADIQGLLLPGGEVKEARDVNGKYLGRTLKTFNGDSTLRIDAKHQIRIGQNLKAGKSIDLVGGIDPLSPDPANGSTNHSGKGIVLYASTQLETWQENSQINLNAPGRVDILAPAHTNEIEATGFIANANGQISGDVSLQLWVNKVDFEIEASVNLAANVTADNQSIEDLIRDLQNVLNTTAWTVTRSNNADYPLNSTYTADASDPDLRVKLREGRFMLASPYKFNLRGYSTNADLLGFKDIADGVTSTSTYAIAARKAGSIVSIGAPQEPNGKLYIAGQVVGHSGINLYSGTSPDGKDIELDGTGKLETINSSIEINAGEYGLIKGDLVAGGLGSDIYLSAENQIDLYGSLTAEDKIMISAGTSIMPEEVSIATFGTSRMDARRVEITGLNNVIIDSSIGEDSNRLTNINISSIQGDLSLARTSGRIVSGAVINLRGQNIDIAGVLRNTNADGDKLTKEITIAANKKATITADVISEGSVAIAAGDLIEVYNGQILVNGLGETLELSQTNTQGNITLGRITEVNNKPTQQGASLMADQGVTLNSKGTVTVNSGVQIFTTAANSNLNVNAANFNLIGSLYGGAKTGGEGLIWQEGAKVTINAQDAVIIGGMGVNNDGQAIARGGSIQSSGIVDIKVTGQQDSINFTVDRNSLIRTELASQATAPTQINIDTVGDLQVFGLIEAMNTGGDVKLKSQGLLLLDGMVRADDLLTVEGGNDLNNYGVILKQLRYRDSQGRLLNGSSVYIDEQGNYVDELGNLLTPGSEPVISSDLNLTRESGGTLNTNANGIISLLAEGDILLQGAVSPPKLVNSNLTVNPASVSITSLDGNVTLDASVGATEQLTIKAQDINLINQSKLRTYNPGSSISLQGDSKVVVAAQSSVTTDSFLEIVGQDLWLGGLITGGKNNRVLLNAADSITIPGGIRSLGDIDIHSGVDLAWTDSKLQSNLTREELTEADISILEYGMLDAAGEVNLLAGGNLNIDSVSNLQNGTKLAFMPFISQKPTIISVVTGTYQVADGTFNVPFVSWIPTTVTEQVGFDVVRVGSEFKTMDVTLTQDGYYNGTTKREYFVNQVDYSVNNINWGTVPQPAVDTLFENLTDPQVDKVIAHLGYKKLYNFSYSNPEVHRTINGNPTKAVWNPSWVNNANTTVNIGVDGWSDKYISLPNGAQADVLRVVSQGTSAAWQENVGQYRELATVRYT